MKDPTVIHTLAQKGAKSGKIRFIHKDDTEHTFTSVVNRLTGDRMSYFDSSAPTVGDSLAWVRSVFRDIRKKSKGVLEVIGDF
jgi:hypothetical protein